nr:MAG TPA: hypothetical protein [Caudoviricetes sp.]
MDSYSLISIYGWIIPAFFISVTRRNVSSLSKFVIIISNICGGFYVCIEQ